MRFTPFSFLATSTTSSSISITNAISGTFSSGSDTYAYYKFTGSGELNIQEGTISNANIFLVGGGSGGRTQEVGRPNGHGGGGGGLLFTSSLNLPAGFYIINVGTGSFQNYDGASSSVICNARGINIGVDGGKLDGTSGYPSYNVKGGYGAGAAGGGGGLGSVGQSGSLGITYTGGDGGTGLAYTIIGSSSFWGAGGGGGGCKEGVPYNGTGGTGGSGIGGNGQSALGGTAFGGTAGATNTGAGGGGEANDSGGSEPGGSGIVIITYKL